MAVSKETDWEEELFFLFLAFLAAFLFSLRLAPVLAVSWCDVTHPAHSQVSPDPELATLVDILDPGKLRTLFARFSMPCRVQAH